MPGQYHDAESGLFYNWNRYYNPETGRYISSDPIGLEGGINTFNYASVNPVLNIDPEGLASQCMPGDFGAACFVGTSETPVLPWGGGAADVKGPSLAPPLSNLFGGAGGVAIISVSGDTPDTGICEMSAEGNQAATEIVKDFGEANSSSILRGKGPIDKCEWLKENAYKYRADQVKATEKAWGCRGSRHQKGGENR